ncbi:4'-phosphopantetheinyl transferase superfamily protein [Acinetobacter sp. S40]|uniref:4'-phosphopantetheinyl transferase family protein n=1 Tax=unclassified Acinetobacter TaxID=196816 RepID=UPI00190C4BD0|nr:MULTISPECIES: 4'-phosphopantetheinyl transferase superfamily protein [unclassified Acinetobacter]MBJ9985562.1 4'-phosphopantetheinyl transferase superfamily protein [Acinetobacter sp. S40]MBK0064600.1 4'-phosphopantetheinyl transferase superfamily protein [Acinetobacter sp. S55]MBK0068011.1 4'-phosphopantetheinyl transferase superfamily protein [Acinetobacter sp. S54]
MTMKNIQVYIRSLADLLDLSIQDFVSRSEYHHYKKVRIYQYRDELIAKALNIPILQLHYETAEQGKPYLQNQSLHFNHSHSQDDYALALSQNVQDLGIDIESLDRKIRFEALAKHAFHPEEYQCWKALEEDVHYWFKVWTTKEAILKAHGMGIRLDLNTLNTQMHPTHDSGQIIDDRLGIFAYQCFDLGHAMLSVAWRSGMGCGAFVVPKIQILKESI